MVYPVYFNTQCIYFPIYRPKEGAMIMILSLYLALWHSGLPMSSNLKILRQELRQWATSFRSDNWLSLAMTCWRHERGIKSPILSRLLPDTFNTCRFDWKYKKYKMSFCMSPMIYILETNLTKIPANKSPVSVQCPLFNNFTRNLIIQSYTNLMNMLFLDTVLPCSINSLKIINKWLIYCQLLYLLVLMLSTEDQIIAFPRLVISGVPCVAPEDSVIAPILLILLYNYHPHTCKSQEKYKISHGVWTYYLFHL